MSTVSAPGKLVLCGEYAVVDGKRAVVAAVSRRALARRDPASDPASDPRAAPLLAAVLTEIERRGGTRVDDERARVTVDTSAFVERATGVKLGLGSSSAACVAYAAALLLEEHGARAVYEVARAAHRAFQGGGSGIDVAASAFGGLLVFRATGDTSTVAPAPPLPRGVDVVVAFTGHAARTQGFVDAYRALADREQHALAIESCSDDFVRACANDDAGALFAVVTRAHHAMDALGQAAGTHVVTPELAAIAKLALDHGGAGKPSGAGGGDVAVCFIPSEDRSALEAALGSAGFPVVDLQIGAPGVRIDP